jgi:antitoxin (DNA-binding transcriptional repressor) of toxin-antitoxin stability system
MDMKAVGIKNLKNNLSRYLDLVREGEIVYVTDRDEVIAEIHKPVSASTTVITRWEAFLNEEERKGGIIRSHHKEANLAKLLKSFSPTPGKANLQSLLDETREDRI